MADDIENSAPDELLQRAQAVLVELNTQCEAARVAKAAIDEAQGLARANLRGQSSIV